MSRKKPTSYYRHRHHSHRHLLRSASDWIRPILCLDQERNRSDPVSVSRDIGFGDPLARKASAIFGKVFVYHRNLQYRFEHACKDRSFHRCSKICGDKFRWIYSGEYIQMSGRAGRRGIDQRGICILIVNEKMEPSTAKMMVKGSADCLNSAFHLSYNKLLNQMRSEDGDPEIFSEIHFINFKLIVHFLI